MPEEELVPRIRCHYGDCVYLEEGYCGAAAIELDPEEGCLTYERSDEAVVKVDDQWQDEVDDLGDLWHDDDEILYEDAGEDDWYEADEDEDGDV
jgi:hypothetical protein